MSERQGYIDVDSAGKPLPNEGVYWQVSDATGTPQWSPVAITSATKATLIAPSGAIAATIITVGDSYISPVDASAGSAGNATSHGIYNPGGVYTTFPVKGGSTFSIIAATATAAKCNFAFAMLNSYNSYCGTANA